MNKTATVEQPEQHLYSKSDAARRLGSIAVSTIEKHIRAGNIRRTKIGRRILISHQELTRIAEEGLPGLSQETARALN